MFQFSRISILAICCLVLLVQILFFITWRVDLKANIQAHRFKPLPTNFVSGLLQLYYYQRLKYTDAFFIPEIYNYQLIFRLHLYQLITVNGIKLHNLRNITFRCYPESPDILYRTNDSLLTVHISTLLSLEATTSIRFYKNSIKYGQTLRFKSAFKRQLVLSVPVLVKDKVSYKFSYQIGSKSEIFLEWPIWPLTSACIHHYRNKTGKKYNHPLIFAPVCLTNKLQVLTSQQLHAIERKALSKWLDIQYSVSNDSSVSPNRRLLPFERAMDSTVCPLQFQSWISKYQTWHARVGKQIKGLNMSISEQRDIILKHNIQFILFENFGSGIADRITHLISTYLIALLTNRFFLFDDTWPEFHKIMQSSLNYQAEIITPWIFHLNEVNANLSLEDSQYFSVKSQIIREERPYREYDYDYEYPERVLLIKSHTGNVVHTVTSPRSIYSEFLSRKLQMREDNLFGCLYHSLIIPRLSMFITICSPKHDSMQYILQMLLSARFRTIGLQIRVGDSYMKDDHQNLLSHDQLIDKYNSFFECAKNLSDGRTLPLVYLMCDSLDLRLAALSKWPFPAKTSQNIQIISSSKPARHISYTFNKLSALRNAMFEAFLFSLCDIHIITATSSFGRFPAFASLQRRPIYSFNAEDRPACSNGDGQVTFTYAGHQWSGIR